MSNSQATTADAELILKLYDLRRESVMREARNFIFGFAPQTKDDVMAIVSDFSLKENAYLRQVVGYWDMAASLVLRGALNEDPARDNFLELLFVYSRLEPFIEEVRQLTGMEAFGLRCRSLWKARRRREIEWRVFNSALPQCGLRRPRQAPSLDIRECRGRELAEDRRRSLRK